MQLGLTDKVAIVTGSGRGIGAETARALAEEGARIVVTDIDARATADSCAALKGDGFQAIAVPADVTNSADVKRLMEAALDAFGSVHVLVNNAGFARDARITKLSEADWDAVVDTVLKGAFLCTKAVAPSMAAQRWGRVVNVSSRAHLGNPGQANYSAAKAGILGFSAALALELGRDGITVNTIAPGFIETDGVRNLPHYQKIRDNAIARTPLGRPGAPRDVAAAVAFLASEAAGYITGATLHVTGGRYAT
ncbi:3-oxoacyl-ACP reductase FabG [Hydrogenophaga intermedia]|uniref:3-oxoacyl-ACP reductase FabG n=1 Tax=Hydrogenophaga intermedia TaxID=65786 RepID=UPI0020443D6C|nr:3-oxoacyl-ACP reductase FabG [Hydrogenophaga intermedia]MCM3562751.1 3-oxoacyl-ACP reductase FabG [Hydrogenophaga intermedia]